MIATVLIIAIMAMFFFLGLARLYEMLGTMTMTI